MLPALKTAFVTYGGYEEHLFLLTLGSLCAVNESRCLDVDHPLGSGSSMRRLKATPRGLYLVGSTSIRTDLGRTVEFSFEFEYLQLVVDDYLLSLPKQWIDSIYVDANLGYSLKDARTYGEKSWEYLQKKTRAVLYFVRLLEASYEWERRFRPGLLDSQSGRALAPDFDRIGASLLMTYDNILGHFERHGPDHAEQMRALWSRLRKDASFDDFFGRYGESGTKMTEDS